MHRANLQAHIAKLSAQWKVSSKPSAPTSSSASAASASSERAHTRTRLVRQTSALDRPSHNYHRNGRSASTSACTGGNEQGTPHLDTAFPSEHPTRNSAGRPRRRPARVLLPPSSRHSVPCSKVMLPQSRHDDVYNCRRQRHPHLRRPYSSAPTPSPTTTTPATITAEGHVELSGGENDEHLRGLPRHLQSPHPAPAASTTSPAPSASDQQRRSTLSRQPSDTNAGIAPPGTHAPGLPELQPVPLRGARSSSRPAPPPTPSTTARSQFLPSAAPRLAALRPQDQRRPTARPRCQLHLQAARPAPALPSLRHASPVHVNQRQSGLLIPVFGYSSASNRHRVQGLHHRRAGLSRARPLRRPHRRLHLLLPTRLLGKRHLPLSRSRRRLLQCPLHRLQDRGFVSEVTGKNIYTNQGGEDLHLQLPPRVHAAHPRRRRCRVPQLLHLPRGLHRKLQPGRQHRHHQHRLPHPPVARLLARRPRRPLPGPQGRPHHHHPGEEVKDLPRPLNRLLRRRPPLSPARHSCWSVTASAAGLKRVQPNFATSGITERIDLRPELSLPLAFGGWHTFSSIALRETAYSRSRQAPYGNGATPVELSS